MVESRLLDQELPSFRSLGPRRIPGCSSVFKNMGPCLDNAGDLAYRMTCGLETAGGPTSRLMCGLETSGDSISRMTKGAEKRHGETITFCRHFEMSNRSTLLAGIQILRVWIPA